MAINGLVYGYVASEEEYPDKEKIIEENAQGTWVYVVLEGRVKVKKKTPQGSITIETLKEGAIFGEMALLDKTKGLRSATIVADGPVKIGILDKDRLDKEYELISPQLKDLIKTLVSRLEDTTTKASLVVMGQ
ncbi:MAG: cyclic nucleotide-binding domain-containing protein [Thermodesulfobacteriota bacterium]|nr:cyclic nucleotide-binding domain-containing protein [Thermodesulfobacteriota bacterium]